MYKDTEDLSYNAIKRSSVYLRDNYDPDVIFHAASTRVQEMDHVIEGKKIAITHVINRGSLWMT